MARPPPQSIKSALPDPQHQRPPRPPTSAPPLSFPTGQVDNRYTRNTTAIPFAAPVPRDYYPPRERHHFRRTHYFEQQHQFVPMPPSASPLYDLPQDQTRRPAVGGAPTAQYEVAVDVDQQYLQNAWAAPPTGGQHWEQPVEYARGIVVGDGEGEVIPFLSSGGNDNNEDSPPERRQCPRRETHPNMGALRTLARDTVGLTVFHLLNACLGFAACSVVTSGASLGLSTLPVCCLGVLVFRILFYVVYAFAQFDMMLGNYIAPPDQFMYAVVPPFDGQRSLTGYRLAPTLACFSPLSLMALLYFCSVKVGIAVLSTAAAVLFLAPPVTFAASLATGYAVPIQYFGVDEISLQSDPAGFSLAVVCLTLVGFALLHGVANLSLLATRFFVCEKFTVYRYPSYYVPGVGGYPGPSSPSQQQLGLGQYHHHHHHHRHLRPDGRTRRERRPFYPVAVVSYGAA